MLTKNRRQKLYQKIFWIEKYAIKHIDTIWNTKSESATAYLGKINQSKSKHRPMELTINLFDSIAFHKCAQMFAIHSIYGSNGIRTINQSSERQEEKKHSSQRPDLHGLWRLLSITHKDENAKKCARLANLYKNGMVANCTWCASQIGFALELPDLKTHRYHRWL